jgi:hypothetical protein
MIIKTLTIVLYPPLIAVGYLVGFIAWPIVSGFLKGYSAALGIAFVEYENEVKLHSVKEEE